MKIRPGGWSLLVATDHGWFVCRQKHPLICVVVSGIFSHKFVFTYFEELFQSLIPPDFAIQKEIKTYFEVKALAMMPFKDLKNVKTPALTLIAAIPE